MSTELKLIAVLEKLVKLQKSLYQVSVNKTSILKEGNVESLSNLIKDEIKHIKAMEMINREREVIQRQLAIELKILPNGLTISQILQADRVVEKERIAHLQQELVTIIQELKQVNEFNQELLNQSLQFVNLNLDLLTGEQDSPNYSKEPNDDYEGNSRSLFDSKA